MNIAYLFFEAKQLIDNFCVSTYGEHADFSDLKKIGIAHTTTEDERFPIQVYVNLIEKQVVTQVGNEIAALKHYKSLEDMIDNCLSDLNFNELTEHENIDSFDFELIEILDKKALFTNSRVPDYALPDGLHKYELRGGDTENFYTVEKSVLVNHSGTILMCEPLEFGKNDYIELDENTTPNFLGIDMSVSEFCTSSENKENFCPYCTMVNGSFYTDVFKSPDSDMEITLSVGENKVQINVQLADGRTGILTTQAKYCPYCGRNIKNEEF